LAKRDYYETLGLQRDASKEDIKRAYRRVAVENHPDRNPGDTKAEERFKEATEAYEVLADDQKRQAYDQFGFAGVEGMGGGGAGGYEGFSTVFRDFEDIFGDFSGIFESFFGGGRRQRGGRRGPARGSDLRYDLEVDFLDAVFGTKVDISFDKQVQCDACNGSGAEEGSESKVCPTCGGTGQVRRSSGFFSIASTCPTCGGEGSTIDNPCKKCNGQGVGKEHRKLKVTIPAGIDHGKRITLRGEGDVAPHGGEAGDLYVVVRVKPHEYFERHGTDVYCVVPISVTQAALGGDIHVPTLDGNRAKVKVPSGTQTGKVLRLRNEGVPHLQDSNRRGDMYVKIRVDVPRKLSGKAKDLMKELSEELHETDQPDPVPLAEL
jgi:molecular chaperone DnaJ